MAKILGFPKDDYNKSQLDNMTDVQLNEEYLENSNVVCYDCLSDFFDSLNDDVIDTENNWWKMVKID